MEPIHTGSIVVSLQGRDKGTVYAVVGTVEEVGKKFFLVSDGSCRRLESPKKKNPIHLQTMCDATPALKAAFEQDTLSDKLLRTELRSLQFQA